MAAGADAAGRFGSAGRSEGVRRAVRRHRWQAAPHRPGLFRKPPQHKAAARAVREVAASANARLAAGTRSARKARMNERRGRIYGWRSAETAFPNHSNPQASPRLHAGKAAPLLKVRRPDGARSPAAPDAPKTVGPGSDGAGALRNPGGFRPVRSRGKTRRFRRQPFPARPSRGWRCGRCRCRTARARCPVRPSSGRSLP